MKKGISLIELLVVVVVFATVGVLVMRSVALSLQGTEKSTAMVHARENLDYAMSIIERQIRNADSITSTPCDGTTQLSSISYLDQNGTPASFSCLDDGSGTSYFIASGSANIRLTSNTVQVTSCSFTCATSGNNPPVVTVNLTVQDASATGITGAAVSASTQINLMNY